MKKFVLLKEYLENSEIGFKAHKREPIAVANSLNSLMRGIVDYAQKILQVRNPNFLAVGKWDVRTDGSHAEIVVAETYGNEDAIRFIIDETDFILDN